MIELYMKNYGKMNKISSVDKVDTKLTMIFDTMDILHSFCCYELWYLIDIRWIVTVILNLDIYEANTWFHTFINECMNEWQAIFSYKHQHHPNSLLNH